jgi:3',5'-cyclic AMP phosphodiesterase CpdA
MGSSILHLSDIHPQPGDDLRQLAQGIADAVKLFKIDFLVVSGDLGYQGQNHRLSVHWLRELGEKLGVQIERIICIPGNHDIDKRHLDNFDQAFRDYSRALLELFGKTGREAVSPASIYVYEDHEFLLINSVYHLDITHGMVDCAFIRKLIRDKEVVQGTKIAIVHHNPIPVIKGDRSTVVNAYEFLRIVSDAGYDVLLHGHQHIEMSLRVGEKTRLAGVGSVNFEPDRNINNQFNVVEVGKRIVRFRFHADSMSKLQMGNWNSTEEPW